LTWTESIVGSVLATAKGPDNSRERHVTIRRRVELAHFGRERIPEPGSPTRFERRVGDCHHYVMCRSYGVVDDVPRGSAPAVSTVSTDCSTARSS
jgi:hypothetical protein